MIWLLRMKRWVQRPPSWRMVRLVFWIVAIAIGLAVYEHVYGWPDWLTVNDHGRRRVPRF